MTMTMAAGLRCAALMLMLMAGIVAAADAPREPAPPVPEPRTLERPWSLTDRAAEWAAGSAGPVLANVIRSSRAAAIEAGVDRMPPSIRARLSGFFPETLLDRVRYRVGSGAEFSVQGYLFLSEYFLATTLDDVIVFRNTEDAETDAVLWAHELAHVQQFERMGIDGFAHAYVRDHQALEHAAMRVAGRYDSWARRHGKAPPITR